MSNVKVKPLEKELNQNKTEKENKTEFTGLKVSQKALECAGNTVR